MLPIISSSGFRPGGDSKSLGGVAFQVWTGWKKTDIETDRLPIAKAG